MKTSSLLVVASLLLTACTTREMDTAAGNVGRVVAYPVTGPANAIANTARLPIQTEYVYWKRIPDTNVYTKVVTNHPLTIEEQKAQGIVVPEATPAQ